MLRKTTSQQDYETTSGAVAGGASQELWNYGTTERASRLKAHGSLLTAQSHSLLSLPSIPFRLLSLVFRQRSVSEAGQQVYGYASLQVNKTTRQQVGR